jgi:type III restriction enzyme
LLWTPSCLWAIDPKGPHLVSDAIYNKLMGLTDISDLPLKIRVAFVLDGEYILRDNNRPQPRSDNGCTLIFKRNVGVRAKHFSSLNALVADLK